MSNLSNSERKVLYGRIAALESQLDKAQGYARSWRQLYDTAQRKLDRESTLRVAFTRTLRELIEDSGQ